MDTFVDHFVGPAPTGAKGSPDPAADTAGEGVFERSSAVYAPRYQRFLVKTKRFTQQYSHVYTKRLMQMRMDAQTAARKAWTGADGTPPVITDKIINLCAGEERVAIGTFYKEMKLKPCILDDFSQEVGADCGSYACVCVCVRVCVAHMQPVCVCVMLLWRPMSHVGLTALHAPRCTRPYPAHTRSAALRRRPASTTTSPTTTPSSWRTNLVVWRW